MNTLVKQIIQKAGVWIETTRFRFRKLNLLLCSPNMPFSASSLHHLTTHDNAQIITALFEYSKNPTEPVPRLANFASKTLR